MEKEFITKKRCATLIKNVLAQLFLIGFIMLLSSIISIVLAYFSSLLFYDGNEIPEGIWAIICHCIIGFWIITAIPLLFISALDLFEGFTSLIQLYRGKFFLVESTLLSKEKKHLHFSSSLSFPKYLIGSCYGPVGNVLHIWKFDKYGEFTPLSTDTALFNLSSGRLSTCYSWSNNKMTMAMADTITEEGEKFYLLVRGGKKKRIYYIFHEKLFAINPDEHHGIYGKYFI
ncbi:MAG: hypothetical protein IKB86_03615 [Clostridia bacterium]|nr:hypothetical protein [Clostridia bacterium]